MPARTRRPAQRRTTQVRAVRSRDEEGRPRIVVRPEELQDFNESINWCVYGNSGVGKTVFSAFAPNAYFLSTEKGVVAAKRVGSEAKLIRAPSWEYVEAALDWADEKLNLDNWLIIDSLSKMQVLNLRWWLGLQNAENESRDIDVPQIQDHQKWQNMFMRFVDRIVDANYNTIFTCTAMHKEDPEGESLVLPAITGKDYTISNYVCAAADIVSCLRMERNERRGAPARRLLLNEAYPPYFAKDRFHVLPRWLEIDYEDYDIIAELIEDIQSVSPEERQAAKAAAAAN
jgi:hypothetical protein